MRKNDSFTVDIEKLIDAKLMGKIPTNRTRAESEVTWLRNKVFVAVGVHEGIILFEYHDPITNEIKIRNIGEIFAIKVNKS